MKRVMLSVLAVVLLSCSPIMAAEKAVDPRPNILWISCEDINPHLGCYGDKYAITPTLDRLAKEGVRYSGVFSTAGVCAPTRSGIITGMCASSIGSQHMRCQATLPDCVKCFPEFLRKAGYYCTNNAKTDYNFDVPKEAWDACSRKAHWKNRPEGKPFFAVFNILITHESQIRLPEKVHAKRTRRLTPEQRQDPDRITPPPFHPNTPLVRHDWAQYYENITAMDYEVADRLRELHEAGLDENTIVFFWGDHGAGLPRMKRWLYDSGTQVPLLVRVPEKYRVDGQGQPNTVDDQLVSFLDLAPTMLNLAGVPLPEQFEGRAFLGKNLTPPREYVYGARDRMDERYDIIRMVRGRDYLYLRNYEPFRTYAQYIDYGEKTPTMQEMRRLKAEGKLTDEVALYFRETKPVEELYDVKADPHQLKNLAGLPDYKEVLQRMRAEHLRWQDETHDLGLIPEAELNRRAEELGSHYAILRQPGSKDLMRRIRATIDAGEKGKIKELLPAMKDPDAAVRYWAVTGLGNLREKGVQKKVPGTFCAQHPSGRSGKRYRVPFSALESALNDSSPTVRVAAARAVYLTDGPTRALPVLIKELKNERPWIRVAAVDVLDMMGDDARPALGALKEASRDKKNKYVVRLSTHAVDELENTK